MEYDVIIIGAGASGLVAAIAAARQGSKVLVLEQKDKPGKKILATGNGKCNFTNRFQSPECYRSEDSSFAVRVLSGFDVTKTLQFFSELGIYPKERDGYLYPNSEQANSVVRVLMLECERLKVNFGFSEKVVDIKKPYYRVVTELCPNQEAMKAAKKQSENKRSKQADSVGMSINLKPDCKPESVRQTYFAKKLIIAAGGCASPQLGSDGSGFLLAKQFGHAIIKPLPALVQLVSADKYCKTVSGVRTAAKVQAYSRDRLLSEESGEILFTDYGISGIPILQISRFVAKELDHGGNVHLLLDFFPELPAKELEGMLRWRIQQNHEKTMEELLIGLLNHKLAYVIILEAKLDPYKASDLITDQEINQLVNYIKEFRMQITKTNSFENAQVCCGGVSTDEICEITMESKLSKNLYLAGEVIDVDGTCGGYNLQWAWSSGYLAGIAAGKK